MEEDVKKLEEIQLAYIHTPQFYKPYISSTNETNTIIKTREYTQEEIHIAGTISIILCIILIVFTLYMFIQFYKYSK